MSENYVYGITFDLMDEYQPEREDEIVKPYLDRLEAIGATELAASFIFDHGPGVGAFGSWNISGIVDVADFAAALVKAAEASAGLGDEPVFSVVVHEAAREDYGM